LEVAADKLVELESLCCQLQQGLQTEKEKTKQLEALLMAPQHHQRHNQSRRLRSSTQRQLQQQEQGDKEDGHYRRVRISDPFRRPPAAISSALIQSYHASVYSSTFLHSSAAMLVLSIQSGQCVDVNEQFCQLSGWNRDQLLGRFFTNDQNKHEESQHPHQQNIPTCSGDLDASDMDTSDDESDGDDEENIAKASRNTGQSPEKIIDKFNPQPPSMTSSSVAPSCDSSDPDPDGACASMTNDLTTMRDLYNQSKNKNPNPSINTDVVEAEKNTMTTSIKTTSKKGKSKLLALYAGKRSIIKIKYRLKNGYGQMVDYVSRCWLGYAQNEVGESVATYLIVQTEPHETKNAPHNPQEQTEKTSTA
jgi:hypothetical protein